MSTASKKPKYLQALELREKGLDEGEIARRLGVTVATVRKYQARAKKPERYRGHVKAYYRRHKEARYRYFRLYRRGFTFRKLDFVTKLMLIATTCSLATSAIFLYEGVVKGRMLLSAVGLTFALISASSLSLAMLVKGLKK